MAESSVYLTADKAIEERIVRAKSSIMVEGNIFKLKKVLFVNGLICEWMVRWMYV